MTPPSANGTAISTISGSSQLWKLIDQEQIDQHHRQRHAGEQPGVAVTHGLDLSAQDDGDRLRRVRADRRQ